MSTKKILTAAALAGILSLSATPSSAHAMSAGMEKCYGIAKTGQNDCGANGHSCAGQAATDGDTNEWVAMPKGTCDKVVGGSIEKPEAKKMMKH